MFLECLGGTEWLTACGDNVCIPASLATYTRLIYNAIRIVTPLVLIIIGMFDMAKAVTSKSAEDVKKAQNLLVKKAIAAAIVFFLFTFVSWMLRILSDTGSASDVTTNANIATCLEQLFIREVEIKKESGIKEGYTDPTALCKNYEYTGYMKIYNSNTDAPHYFYTCYERIKDVTTCKKYRLGDNKEYCLQSIDREGELGYIFVGKDANAYNNYAGGKVGNFDLHDGIGEGRASTQDCKSACKLADMNKSALIIARTEMACMCVK